MFERNFFITDDGSVSINIPKLNESYHSTHGAIQESIHIYINNGLKKIKKNEINIFELGIGTGLNVLLTYLEVIKNEKIKINYTGIEKYPLSINEINKLNYCKLLNINNNIIKKIHSEWNKKIFIDDNFSLLKINTDFSDYEFTEKFDLVFFDAFAPNIQPKLWQKDIFEKIYCALNKNGILVTYSVKGEVKRILKSLNFKVESPPGPAGKRNMLRAIKL